jgi:hypothetical protein
VVCYFRSGSQISWGALLKIGSQRTVLIKRDMFTGHQSYEVGKTGRSHGEVRWILHHWQQRGRRPYKLNTVPTLTSVITATRNVPIKLFTAVSGVRVTVSDVRLRTGKAKCAARVIQLSETFDMVIKPTKAHKRWRVSYILNTLWLLHVSAKLVAIFGRRFRKDLLQNFWTNVHL